MPKIAQYQPNQVQTQVARQPRMSGQVPSAAFGGPIAKGAMDIAQAGRQLTQRVDTTSAEEALVQFERDKNELFFNPETGYFNTQGRNAYDGSSVATQSMEDLKSKYGDTLNTQAKLMFDRAAEAHIIRGKVDVSRHASKGLKAWEVATIESQVENSIENASLYWNDSKRLNVQKVLGRQAVIDSSEMQGIGAEATAEKVQTFESAFAKSTIEAATQSSSVEGEKAMEDHGDKLEGPFKVKMQKVIDTKAKAEETQFEAQKAVLTATSLNRQYESRADIIDEVNKIKDPTLRKKTMTESMSQFSRKEQAEKEQSNDYYQTIIGEVNKGASATEIQAQNSTAWLGMTDKQRNNILAGKHMITDQILLAELRLLPVKEKAKVNPLDYSDKLKPSDLQKLTSEVNSAKKGKVGSRVMSLSKKSMDAAKAAFSGKWSTKGSGLTNKGKKANEFLETIQNAVDDFEETKGSKITPAEENQLISDFTREITIERSAFGFDILAADIEIDLSNTPAKDIRTLNQIIDNTSDIDLKDLTGAYQFLIDNDQPVTVESLRSVYTQGRQ